jgi:uncharacterized protein YjiS (DUF1127 family)
MFTAPTIQGSTGPKGPDGLATLGSRPMLTTALTATFGRVARSYAAWSPGRARPLPSMPSMAPAAPVGTLRREGLAASAARVLARALAWLARAAERRGQQWARQRERRLTEHLLRQLDSHTLRDLGLTHGEIPSMAAEVAGQIEATRTRAWLEIGSRVV